MLQPVLQALPAGGFVGGIARRLQRNGGREWRVVAAYGWRSTAQQTIEGDSLWLLPQSNAPAGGSGRWAAAEKAGLGAASVIASQPAHLQAVYSVQIVERGRPKEDAWRCLVAWIHAGAC